MSIFDMFSKKQEAVQPTPTQLAEEENKPELPPFAKKILVVVDGSKRAYDAANYAIALASHLPGCELCAAFVIDVASLDSLMQMHIFVKEERANFEAE
ncbi:MAG: universal stress protein, partial [Victivallales bacterium]|nr:universal stress protein [Victivallales bacterium]